MTMPSRAARSATIRLAIEPTSSRLPAKVLTSASTSPASKPCRCGSSSITAGTLETRFDSTTPATSSTPGVSRARPRAASHATACAASPVDSKAWLTTNRPMNSSSSGQSTKPSTRAECRRRLSSSTAAPTSAATSRGTSVNRKSPISAAATVRPLALCQASKGGSSAAGAAASALGCRAASARGRRHASHAHSSARLSTTGGSAACR